MKKIIGRAFTLLIVVGLVVIFLIINPMLVVCFLVPTTGLLLFSFLAIKALEWADF